MPHDVWMIIIFMVFIVSPGGLEAPEQQPPPPPRPVLWVRGKMPCSSHHAISDSVPSGYFRVNPKPLKDVPAGHFLHLSLSR